MLFVACLSQWVWISELLNISPTQAGGQQAGVFLNAAVCLVMFMVFAVGRMRVFKKAVHIRKLRHRLLLFNAVIGTAGYLAILIELSLRATCALLPFVGAVAYSASFIVTYLLLFKSLQRLSLRQTVLVATASLIFAIVLLTSVSAFSPGLLRSLGLVLPALVSICLIPLIAYRQVEDTNSDETRSLHVRLPVKNICSSILTGVSFGLFIGLGDFELSSLASVPMLVCAILLLIACVMAVLPHLIKNPNDVVFQVSFPIMALSYLLAIFFGMNNGAFVVQFVGATATVLMGISLLSHLIRNFNVSLESIIWPTPLLFFGYYLGAYAGAAIPSDYLIHAESLMLFLLLGSSVLLVKDRKLRLGWIEMDMNVQDMSMDYFKFSCSALSREHFLTDREAEVFVLIATGHNRQSIARQLFISEETVKSHQKKIYRKLGVHNQQEAIDTVYKKARNLTQ
jgi:DNA-binding CsgD family transcriptional regulator